MGEILETKSMEQLGKHKVFLELGKSDFLHSGPIT